MKHRITKWCLGLFFLVGNFSCSNILEVEPQNTPTFYNFFKDEKDFQSLIMAACYDYRNTYTVITRRWGGEVFDECTDKTVLSFLDLDPTVLNSSSIETSWWIYYKIIQQTLLVSEYIDQIKLSEERRDFWAGQALFYRGLCYFEIVRDWGDCPILPLSDNVKPLARESWPKVLDLAIQCMEDAQKLLGPWNTLKDAAGKHFTTKQVAGKEAASAMLAHMYAWKGNLLKDEEAIGLAIDAATFVIDNLGVGVDPTPEEVCTKVLVGGHSESIFEISMDYSEILSPRSWIHSERLYQCYPLKSNSKIGDVYNVYSRFSSERVMHMYQEHDGVTDLRRDAYFYKVEQMKDSTDEGWAYMQKRRAVIEDKNTYPQWPDQWFINFGGNVIITRLADIILLRAECYAKLDKNDLAIFDLNRIRDRAKAARYASSEGSVYRMVFEEREKELLCEKHRLYDLIRTGYWKTDLSEAFSKLTNQDVEDGALYLPVYDKAFSSNPLMRQNRFWDKKK